MAKKKVVKKAAKKTTTKVEAKPMPMKATCNTSSSCSGIPILALLIIILAWWKPAIMWSQIVITIAAAIIFLSGNCMRK